jgi:hypothetical protein
MLRFGEARRHPSACGPGPRLANRPSRGPPVRRLSLCFGMRVAAAESVIPEMMVLPMRETSWP